MGERWNRAARAAFPWGKLALCALIAAAGCGGYWYWTATRADDGPVVRLAILVFKSEKRVEVWGEREEVIEASSLRAGETPAPRAGTPASQGGMPAPQGNHGLKARVTLLREYPVLASSGTAGPKLRGGDRQVPEGIYKIVELNPRSRFHLSMKLDYPNAFDKAMAQKDGRTALGGDVCIHGKNTAVGCVAIGDAAIEDLYALVTQVKAANVTVIIAPNDLREQVAVRNPALKLEWLPELYGMIARELKAFAK